MKTRILITALTFLLSLQFANAQKIIYGGPVEGLWEYNNSPYIIRGSIYVDDYKTLQIEAGVHVIFETTDPFIVNGSLIAVGNSSDTILFSTNIPDRGWGGIRFEEILSGNEMSQLSYCKFEYATARGEWPYHSGGAIGVKYTNKLTIDHSLFENNRALEYREDGAKNGASGGAIAIWLSEIRLTKNVYRYNEAINGGAIFIDKYSKAIIDNSLFYENTANNNGGAVSVSDHAIPGFINCTFADNYANNKGGAVSIAKEANPTFVNSLLWGNSAFDGGDQVNITDRSGINLYYSNIEGGLGRIDGYSVDDNTNIFYEYDPKYLSTGAFPYALSEDSPVVDMGTLNSLFMPQDYQHPAADLHDNQRILGMTIDIGYYENELYPQDHPVDIDKTNKSTNVYSDFDAVIHTGTQSDFVAIHFADASHGWVIAEDGIMIYTKDGGLTWEEKYFGPSYHLQDVHFIDNNNGFLVGSLDVGPQTKGFIHQTNDGGETWEVKYLSVTQATINHISFSDDQQGFASGNTLDPSGNEGINMVTNDGGETWEEIALHAPGIRFSNIHFPSPNEGWAVGTMDIGPDEVSVIFKSDNGGRAWIASYYNTSDVMLEDISFDNVSNGFVTGDQGSILTTKDAGSSWKAQNFGEYSFNAALAGENNTGWVVGDNGVILTTHNNGNDWVYVYAPHEAGNLNAICSTPHGYIWVAGDAGTLFLHRPNSIENGSVKQDLEDRTTKEAGIHGDNMNQNNEKGVGPIERHKNYPNPFAGKTTISFMVNHPTHVKLNVFNIGGQLVATLVDRQIDAGNQEVIFDANDLTPGIYTYMLSADNQLTNGKMIINR